MKVAFEINDQARSGVKKAFISKVVLATLEQIDLEGFRTGKISLSLAVVSEKEIARINKKYRKKNGSTDVLSFSEYKNFRDVKKDNQEKIYLGEIIVCLEDIKKYAAKEKTSLGKELAKAVSHGTLHLLGFRHGEKMFEIQERVAKKTIV